jgi:hypothetical protein
MYLKLSFNKHVYFHVVSDTIDYLTLSLMNAKRKVETLQDVFPPRTAGGFTLGTLKEITTAKVECLLNPDVKHFYELATVGKTCCCIYITYIFN